MLKIALPNKGSLADEALRLMNEAGYVCKRYDRELRVQDEEHAIDFIFLRPRDIAVYVERGVLDLGITGRDLVAEAGVAVTEMLQLGFGRSRFCYAVPKQSDLTPERFTRLRIGCAYPQLVRHDLQKRGIAAEVISLDGAVEISIALGVADVIADVVQSGRTIQEAGLKIVGEPLLESEAVLIARKHSGVPDPALKVVMERLQGIVVARDYVMVEYDAPQALLDVFCALTPGIESPTIAPLSKSGWVAVKAMVQRKGINDIMDQLAAKGARGIIVTNIQACRL